MCCNFGRWRALSPKQRDRWRQRTPPCCSWDSASYADKNCARDVGSLVRAAFETGSGRFFSAAPRALVPVGGNGCACNASREPLLFACTNATGTFEVDPIFDFSQADLEEEDVYLLDCFTTVFIWIGSAANEQEKTMALETAKVYVQAQGYSEDTAICQVTSGNEPALFTCNFLGWDGSAKKKFVDPYEAKLAAAMHRERMEGKSSPIGSRADKRSMEPGAASLVANEIGLLSGRKVRMG